MSVLDTAIGGEGEIDLEDLIPAQVFALLVLVRYGIVELTAYSGAVDLSQVYAIGGIDVSLAFLGSVASLGVIVLTNELTADDVIFWDEDRGQLDAAYGFAVAATLLLVVGVEFSATVQDAVTGSDVLGTAAFGVSVVAIWAIVWVR